MLRVLDLFSGIGGFSLGLERAGMSTVAFCEIDPFCRAVLAQHWPEVPIYDDVKTLTADALRRDGIAVDVICGGFPCQDISSAGKRAGIQGERSGLWSEYGRLIGELRPQFVIVENVAALLGRGLGDVLGDLASLGYDATWDCIPACAVGAPHRRDRIWIIAYAGSEQHEGPSDAIRRETTAGLHAHVAHSSRVQSGRQEQRPEWERIGERGEPEPMADTDCHARDEGRSDNAAQEPRGWHVDRGDIGTAVCHSDRARLEKREGQRSDAREELSASVGTDWWFVEPDVGRVADGVPARVDRLRSLGNAVVPQIPEIIGRAIIAATT